MTSRSLHTAWIVPMALAVLSGQTVAAERDLASLEPRLTHIVSTARGQVGISIFHAETGARLFSYHGQQPFAMASVYKLPIAFELLTQIAEGRLMLDQRVTI